MPVEEENHNHFPSSQQHCSPTHHSYSVKEINNAVELLKKLLEGDSVNISEDLKFNGTRLNALFHVIQNSHDSQIISNLESLEEIINVLYGLQKEELHCVLNMLEVNKDSSPNLKKLVDDFKRRKMIEPQLFREHSSPLSRGRECADQSRQSLFDRQVNPGEVRQMKRTK